MAEHISTASKGQNIVDTMMIEQVVHLTAILLCEAGGPSQLQHMQYK